MFEIKRSSLLILQLEIFSFASDDGVAAALISF